MATYLYCLLASPRADAGERLPSGIGGAAVRALPVGELVAWVSDLATPLPDMGALASGHAAVLLAAVHAGLSPLPARVGQHFADDAALRAMVAPRVAEFSGALERLDGRVEMTLHLHLSGDEPAPADSPASEQGGTMIGRAYLERRRTELERAARDLHYGERLRLLARERLGDLVDRDACLAIRGGRRYILAHLVRRESAAAWRARASALRFDGVERTFVAGPLPACSFSMDESAVAESDEHGSGRRRNGG